MRYLKENWDFVLVVLLTGTFWGFALCAVMFVAWLVIHAVLRL